MNCKKCQKLYLLSPDNQLSPKQKEYMEQHLRFCPACQKQALYIQSFNSKLENQDNILPSEQVLQNILDKAYQNLQLFEKQPVFLFPRVRVIVPRLAYALAVVVAIFFVTKVLITERQTSSLKTIQIAKIERGIVHKDFAYADRYFNNAYINDVKKKLKQTFFAVEETKKILTIASKKYDFNFEPKRESLDGALLNLERSVKKINGMVTIKKQLLR